MKSTFTKICMFAIKADNLQLVKKVVALPPYRRENELNALIRTANRDLTAKDFRDAGLDELVDGDEASPSIGTQRRMSLSLSFEARLE